MLQHPSIRTISFVAALFFTTGVALKNASAQVIDRTIVVELQADPNKTRPKSSGAVLNVPHINYILHNLSAPVGKYQIGVACFPVDGALRAQLNLPKGQGLLVDKVLPNQPAAKAGVKQHDVILAVDGAKVGDVKDLVAAIDKAKDSAIKLEVLRGGKKQTIAVTPVKRPQVTVFGLLEGKLPGDVIKRFEIEGFRAFGIPKDTTLIPKEKIRHLEFHAIRPGVFIRHHIAQLPKNLSITITRSGEQPVKIVVKKSDQKWEVTEKQLDKLPKEVRGHVERMLGRGRPDVSFFKNLDVRVPGTPHKVVPAPPRAQRGQPVEKQLEQMRGELREIRKALDELLKSRRKPRGKKAKSE